MPITIEYTPEEASMIQAHAMARNVSVEELIHQISLKAIRNTEYLAKLDRAFRQIEEGRCQAHDLIEVDE